MYCSKERGNAGTRKHKQRRRNKKNDENLANYSLNTTARNKCVGF